MDYEKEIAYWQNLQQIAMKSQDLAWEAALAQKAETAAANARIAELEADNAALEDSSVRQFAKMEAENAALKAANEWHYLPETPELFTAVIIPRGELATAVMGFYGEKGNWYLNTHHGGVVRADFIPRAWSYLSFPSKRP